MYFGDEEEEKTPRQPERLAVRTVECKLMRAPDSEPGGTVQFLAGRSNAKGITQ